MEFDELVTARGTALLRFALMLCGDPDRAQDLVQSVLVKAYRRWAKVASANRPEAHAPRRHPPLRSPLIRRCDVHHGGRLVTDQQLDDLVRAAFRRHEHLVDGDGLLPAVRGRIVRRQRAVRTALAASATGLVLAGSAAGVFAFGPDRAAPPTDRTTPSPANSATTNPTQPVVADDTPPPVPPGWTAYSSRGAEVTVPSGWAVNNYGCGMDARPSVVRAQGLQRTCLTPEPPTKELAILGDRNVERPGAGRDLRERAIRVSGVAAYRADGRLPDGRWAGWVRIPSHDVLLVVRTRSATTTGRILDSARLVNADRHGCTTNRPAADRPAPPRAPDGFVPANPRSITICYYDTYGPAVLAASTRLTGAPAKQVAEALNQAKPGPNPDRPSPCDDGRRPGFNTELRITGTDGTTTVFVRFEGCTGRGMDNGAQRAAVTQTIIHRTLQPLHVGYGFDGDLPQ